MTKSRTNDPVVTSIAAGKKPTRAGLVTVCMADVQPVPIKWLWRPYIALGKLTVIAGHPGLGKSMLTASLAAHISTGRAWADGKPCPKGSVILASAEDDPADTLRPRLDAAGAAVEHVHHLACVRDANGERAFSLADVVYLEERVASLGDCKLVVIDPFSAFMGSVDSHKNAEVRGLLTPLAMMAAKHGCAIVTISHLNKAAGEAIGRVTGSMGLVAAARAAYAVSRDQEDPHRRVILPVKNNLGNDLDGLSYRITQTEHEVPYIVWDREPVKGITADEALAPVEHPARTATGKGDAADFLREILANGSQPVKLIRAEASGSGLSWRTIERAKEAMPIRAQKHTDESGKSYWSWVLKDGKADPYTPRGGLGGLGGLPCAPTVSEAFSTPPVGGLGGGLGPDGDEFAKVEI